MASANKVLTPEAEDRILELCGRYNNVEISKILQQELGVTADRSTISKFLSTRRPDEEIAKYTRAVVQDYISTTVLTDLEILERVRDDLYVNYKNEDEKLTFNQRMQSLDRLNKVIDTRLKYAGAEQPANHTTNVVVNKYNNIPDEDLKAELERLENMG